ncbi:MAG: S-layer homology domain-containing protein [Clostridia bacterium]|nr:S-layer homology domain-containing protein [Clostridia bacterium]
MKKRTWIWLLTAVLIAVVVLPAAAFAGGTVELWSGTTKDNTTEVAYTLDDTKTVFTWVADDESIVDITKGDNKATFKGLSEGSTTVTAYEKLDDGSMQVLDSWVVNVTAKKATELVVKSNPTKTSYTDNQVFSPAGMVVDLVYNNGEKDESIALSESNCSWTPSGKLDVGDTTVAVTYGGISTNVTVKVDSFGVDKIEITDTRKDFTVGDTLSEIKIKVTYNDGTFAEISGGTGYSIEPSTPLKTTDTSYTVSYGGKSASKSITVKPKEYTLELASGSKLSKTSYKSGDKFDATGVTLNIKQGSDTKKTLKDKDLSDIFNYTIKDSDVGKTEVTVSFSYTYDNQKFSKTFTFTGLTITANKTALDLYEIVNVEMEKTAYPVGYRFATTDIDFIQYTQSRNGSVKKLYSDDFSKYSDSIDIEVLTVNSRGTVTAKSSTSSNLRTIQEADVQTDSKGKKFVTLRVYVGREDYDFDVSIGDLGGVSVYYGNTLLTYYEDIMDALDAIADGDSALTSYSSRTSGTYTIKLGEDQKVTRNYSDYDPARYVSIDLNGYNLTFYSSTVDVSSRNKYTLGVTNTSSTTSKFEYYDLDEVLLIDKGESVTFDSDLDRGEVPGLYTVKIADTKNGKVTAKPEARNSVVEIAHGNDITFTITPDENYQIDTVKLGSTTVSSTSNKDYTLNATTGAATYAMKNVIKDGQTLTVTFKEIPKKEEPKKEETLAKTAWTNPFTDVSSRATYYDDVRFVNQNGLMNGMSATTFGASQTMTRAQFVTTLGRMYFSDYNTVEEKDAAVLRIYGTNSDFTDVSYNEIDIKYAVPYINWATANGLILGYGNGTFGPRDNITHQQMYIIMYRYATSLAKKTVSVANETLKIPDANKIGEFWTEAARDGALTAAKYAQQQSFLVSSGAMDPNGDAYRFELATLLHRFSVNVLGWKD